MPPSPKNYRAGWRLGRHYLTLTGRAVGAVFVPERQRWCLLVDAWARGGLLVHRATNRGEEGRWAVSHAATGLRVCAVAGEHEACRLGDLLINRAGACLALSSLDEVQAAAPPWLAPYLRECRQSRRCVDPTQFVRSYSNDPQGRRVAEGGGDVGAGPTRPAGAGVRGPSRGVSVL